MKRSEINRAIVHALRLSESCRFYLPPFAHWKLAQWRENRHRLGNLCKVGLGWDVTDFGSGDFARYGAVLFTLRNGSVFDATAGTPYAEKLIVQREEQEIPLHCHRLKTEDIINRGSGILCIQLYGSTPDGTPDAHSSLLVKLDGFVHTLPAGVVLEIEPGASITLTPGLYHRFWAKKGGGDLLAGEVSSINDDKSDNVFANPVSRFSEIEEDEPVLYPLCNEYERILNG